MPFKWCIKGNVNGGAYKRLMPYTPQASECLFDVFYGMVLRPKELQPSYPERNYIVPGALLIQNTYEIINLEHALADDEMKLPEKFLVMSIVDIFSKSWKNFGMTRKHQKGRLSLDDLLIAISIEEEHRNQTHKMLVEHQSRANLILGKQRVRHWAKLCPNKKAKTGQAVVNMIVGGSNRASISGATEGPSPERHTSLTHEESDIPRRSKRARIVKDFGSNFVTYNINDDPVTFKDAMASSEAKQWKEAVKSEMDSIVSNGTWVLVDLPPGYTTIGCEWIFKKKLKPDGSVDKFKARLVAKGFKQKEGIDYFDTYSLVARLTTVRVLIALASVYNLLIHQMDEKIAFLYGELEKKIYMDQPEDL
ncbi:Retrovirus-related Pol polyprotein from transposon TNT 1-94 [Sesamum angolense]|uniref:Retrovirus-related Pol polyprotein from transposon TNT 1-94 n=1 Tax=Sesamum angolense TaxID=2727404 RepID=A0AAE2BQU2_9LAMI|nr:Retrovirus-related Pol polyprotein from transposon TNT 1-94 [Sesamum angolense]